MNRRRNHDHPKASHERWLVSYADFVTLLFAFFVVMYASSRSDKIKVRQLAVAIQNAFTQLGMFTPASAQLQLKLGGGPAAPVADSPAALKDQIALQSLRQQLQTALTPQIKSGQVSLNLSRQGLVIRIQELGVFASGSDQLQPSAASVLQDIGAELTNLPNPVRVEGYTDNVPIHTPRFDSNWQLSTARAAELVNLFISTYHIAPERLSAAGYAEFHPIASNATPDGRQLNRRVDLVVVSLDAARTTEPSAPAGDARGFGRAGLWPKTPAPPAPPGG